MKKITTTAKKHDFDPHGFLSMIGKRRRMISFDKKSIVFAQGDPTDGLFFIQEGKVQLTVVSDAGKEATLGILSTGDFFGEGGLTGQLLRVCSATSLTDCVLLHVGKKSMMLSMSREPKLSAMFTQSLLIRNARYQDDLIDQLFNSSEKRLARMLLLMAQFGKAGVSEKLIPRLSQETMAEMVGTTRSRVCFFMNRFRRHGYINYDVGMQKAVKESIRQGTGEEKGRLVAHAKTSTMPEYYSNPNRYIRDGGLTMEPLTVFYEDRPDVMAPVLVAAIGTPPSQKPKTTLIRVTGKVTDESLVALYQASRGYPAASFRIVDLSAVTDCAVSCDFIRNSASQQAARTDTHSPLFIVAPQPCIYGLCRMFQTLAEGTLPSIFIVHTLDEAFAAIGFEPPHFQLFAIPA